MRDGAVGRVALAPRAQLDELHRLAGVEVEDVTNPEAEAERIGRLALAALAGEALPLRRYGFVAVVERESGDLIGDAGLHPLGGRGPDIEVGYTLARRAWGRGYGSEAARALVEHAFARLSATRVVAQVEPDNRASRHVLEKLGMTERATRIAHGRPHLLYVVERAGYTAMPHASETRAGGVAPPAGSS